MLKYFFRLTIVHFGMHYQLAVQVDGSLYMVVFSGAKNFDFVQGTAGPYSES